MGPFGCGGRRHDGTRGLPTRWDSWTADTMGLLEETDTREGAGRRSDVPKRLFKKNELAGQRCKEMTNAQQADPKKPDTDTALIARQRKKATKISGASDMRLCCYKKCTNDKKREREGRHGDQG
eukprot:2701139-Pleurochrysis_carterae.AAC.1